MTTARPAAFFRLEGTLVARPTLAAAAWLAANAWRVRERVVRLGATAAALPLAFGPLQDHALANRVAWAGLRGVSADRLHVLGEEYAERFLCGATDPAAARLLRECGEQGFVTVLVTDNLDVVARPVADHLGIDVLVSNRLELREGRATGRLADPVLGAHLDGAWARRLAEEHGLDLRSSRAYGAREADSVLLGAVGNPCTVHPDRRLRRIARQLDWPIVEA